MLGVGLRLVIGLWLLGSAHVARAEDPARIEVTESPELMETSTRERIQERLSSVADRVGECFAEDSTVVLSFDVNLDRDGVVQRLGSSDEGNLDEIRCVRPLLQRLRFDPQSTSTTFRISVSPPLGLARLVEGGAGGFGLAGVGRGGGNMRPAVVAGSAAVRGSLSREVIRRVIRRHINRVRHCYERQLQSEPSLEGRLTIRFTIAATGNIQSATAAADTLHSGAVQSCVVQVVRSMRFPAPNGGGIVVVSYPFIFRPGTSTMTTMTTTTMATPMTPVVRPGMASVRGRLDRAEILRVVRRNQAAVRYCYEVELQRAPGLEGRLTARFEILPTGRVASASIASDTMGNNNVSSCIARQIRRWRFPQPEGGGSVSVSYPFVFTSR